MSHSDRCISANRFGDGFDCICDEEPLPVALAQIRALKRELAESAQREQRLAAEYQQLADANARQAAELLTLREGPIGPQMALALARVNLFRGKQLDDIGEVIANLADEAYEELPADARLAVVKCQEILQRERPEHIGPPEMVHAPFTWREPKRTDGFYDALPGDGFGFAQYVEDFGLRMQFDCAGVLAVADLSLEALKHTMAKEGFSIWPMVLKDNELFRDPVLLDMGTRIEELERQLKAEKGDNERLMSLRYGDGDERDHVRIAVDRAASLEWKDGDEPEHDDEPGKGTE